MVFVPATTGQTWIVEPIDPNAQKCISRINVNSQPPSGPMRGWYHESPFNKRLSSLSIMTTKIQCLLCIIAYKGFIVPNYFYPSITARLSQCSPCIQVRIWICMFYCYSESCYSLPWTSCLTEQLRWNYRSIVSLVPFGKLKAHYCLRNSSPSKKRSSYS